MALFKFLRGPASRINTTSTPLHEGYAYITADEGKFYVDTSSERIKTGVDVYFSATQPTPETKEAIWFKTETTASDNVSNEENE